MSPCHRAHVPPASSRENIAYDMAMDIGEAIVTALEAVGEAFVVEA
jgi:hypothetical protein